MSFDLPQMRDAVERRARSEAARQFADMPRWDEFQPDEQTLLLGAFTMGFLTAWEQSQRGELEETLRAYYGEATA